MTRDDWVKPLRWFSQLSEKPVIRDQIKFSLQSDLEAQLVGTEGIKISRARPPDRALLGPEATEVMNRHELRIAKKAIMTEPKISAS